MRATSLFFLISITGAAACSLGSGCSSSGSDPSPGNPALPPDTIPDGGELPVGPTGPQPDLGTPHTADKAPPPISGGTLTTLGDGKTVIASDPDRDRMYIVDVSTLTKREIVLQEGDEPGRVVADAKGNAHVALRRGGAVVDIDVAAGTVLGRREVCGAPRGIAYDAKADALHVACVGGELVTLPAAGGAPTRTLKLDSDLRDVLVRGDKLVVTRFRSAEILTIDATGKITDRRTPTSDATFGSRSPAVAWRMFGGAKAISVVHQGGQDDPVGTQPGGYGGGGKCGGIVDGEVTTVQDDGEGAVGAQTHYSLPRAVLPVDVAVDEATGKMAVVAAGNSHNAAGGFPGQLYILDAGAPTDPCGGGGMETNVGEGEFTALTFVESNKLVLQSRSPAKLVVYAVGFASASVTIPLSDIDVEDTGHRIFHANSGAFVACASCHPEGGDDGRVWNFVGIGNRRTQTFRGGLLGTEPFHWDGDQRDIGMLMTTVFQKRMSGPTLRPEQITTLSKWIDRIPVIPKTKTVDAAAIARGDKLFHDDTVACASCHSGARLTNNATVDVGTGGPLQVPSLHGIAFRAPYMHTGCAKTLADRFGACGGGDLHGKTSHLTPAQIADLVAYLETL